MDSSEYLSHLRQDGAALAAAAREGGEEGLRAPVLACPEWDVAKLVLHMGIVHRWQAAIVGTHAQAPPDMSGSPRAPDGLERVEWLEEATGQLLVALKRCDVDEPLWNFSDSDKTAGFWFRRSAQETAVHRWDMQAALGMPQPIDADLAADGIAEMFEVMLPRVASGLPREGLGGSLHLHCTDARGEWLVQLGAGRADVERSHAKADAAIRGVASDLDLFVWNRKGQAQLEVIGDIGVADRWPQLVSL